MTRLICLAGLICAMCVATPVIGDKFSIENMCSSEHGLTAGEAKGKRLMSESISLTATADIYPDWVLLKSTPELGRGGANMVYDSARAMTVMFGGWVATGPVAETWEYHAQCNFWSQVRTTHSPLARVFSARGFYEDNGF